MAGKVLIVEDDYEVLEVLERTVRALGLETEYASDGELGLEKALDGNFDLLLLDVNLPEVSGFRICEKVRARHPGVPIIMVTSREGIADRVEGLSLGADDYLVKPFHSKELAARVQALLRRTGIGKPITKSTLQFGELRIDTEGRQVWLAQTELQLTRLEFDVLAYLASHPGRVFSRRHLMEALWGYECSQFGPSITTYLSRLRGKLEKDPKSPRYIKTVHGSGYKFTGHEL